MKTRPFLILTETGVPGEKGITFWTERWLIDRKNRYMNVVQDVEYSVVGY